MQLYDVLARSRTECFSSYARESFAADTRGMKTATAVSIHENRYSISEYMPGDFSVIAQNATRRCVCHIFVIYDTHAQTRVMHLLHGYPDTFFFLIIQREVRGTRRASRIEFRHLCAARMHSAARRRSAAIALTRLSLARIVLIARLHRRRASSHSSALDDHWEAEQKREAAASGRVLVSH